MADGETTNQALATLMTRGTVPVKRDRTLRAIGIDLGTTNSTVAEAVWEPGAIAPVRARCLEIDQQTDEGLYTHVLVPSVVVLDQGKVLVGEGAKPPLPPRATPPTTPPSDIDDEDDILDIL